MTYKTIFFSSKSVRYRKKMKYHEMALLVVAPLLQVDDIKGICLNFILIFNISHDTVYVYPRDKEMGHCRVKAAMTVSATPSSG
jgi:tricorn protease-like protein